MTDFKEYIFTTIKDYLGSLHFTRASAITSVYNNLNTPFNEHTDNANTITFSVVNETSPDEIIDIIKSKLYHYATVEVCSITVAKADTKITITLTVVSPNYQHLTEKYLIDQIKSMVWSCSEFPRPYLFPDAINFCKSFTNEVDIVQSVHYKLPTVDDNKDKLVEFIKDNPNNIYTYVSMYHPTALVYGYGNGNPECTLYYISAADYHYGRYNKFGPHPVGLQQND